MGSTLETLNTVEIEINSRCNRKCSYCPVSVLPVPEVPKYMDEVVLERILDELARIGFTGRISYQFYNEPLIRRDLENVVRRVGQRLPQAYQVLYTNGDLLSDERYKRLIDAGINHFKITSHSLKPHPNRPFQEVLFPKDLELTNRGGVMVNLPGATPEIRSLPCFAPSEMLIITVTGDIVLCYEDVERRHIMGNILTGGLEEIWFSKKFVRIRKLAAEGKRAIASAICQQCTNQAHQIPGTSYIP
ncbi:MAG: SPASM domain-containing protein [Acidobacteria bacterium]|nr:SPASM domain-containing protein [Acidobacteriota bacterium]